MYNVFSDHAGLRFVEFILFLYLRAVVIIAGPSAYAVILASIFAFSFLTVMVALNFARSIFFWWVWRHDTRKVTFS